MDLQKLPFSSEISFPEFNNTKCFFEKVFHNSFRFTESIKNEIQHTRIDGDDLFSFFTANIIKERQVFTR
jgi:hypothetical protein